MNTKGKLNSLPYGKEIVRTDRFLLIYLGSGNWHYSFVRKSGMMYGHFRTKTFLVKALLVFLFFLSFPIYIFSRNYNDFLPVISSPEEDPNLKRIIPEESMEVLDLQAKAGDEKFLSDTEEQKKRILSSVNERQKFKLYRANAGETVREISERYKVDPKIVGIHSDLELDKELKEGQHVMIPEKPGIFYTFKAGDTLAKIASLYRVPIEDIVRENELQSPDFFSPEERIFLPNAYLPDPPPVWYRPVKSTVITSGYGWRTYPRTAFHEAWDIQANYEPVYAVKSGKVIYSGWMGGYGNAVILEHTKELKSLYAHNSRITVREGEYIQGGKQISISGCTGYCFGAHLHLEIIKNGISVNPKDYIKGYYPR